MLARKIEAPLYLVKEVAELQRLPVINFAAGGIATPADAALMMQLGTRRRVRRLGHLQVRRPGAEGQGDRRGGHQLRRPEGASPRSPRDWGRPMKGIEISTIKPEQRLQERGW